MKKTHAKGFTLLELIIVIALIGLISAVVMVALSDSREHSRNTARVAQIKEYQKAFNLYYSDTGYYPRYGAGATATVCLGDYPDDRCWQDGTSAAERAAFASTFTPQYMGQMPAGETIVYGQGDAHFYEGIVYVHQNYGKAYTIRYFMEGNDKDCLIDGATGSNVGDDTMCTLVVSS